MILKMQNVVKNYRQPGAVIEVLKGVNLQIERPETIAILGESGSGKSTLLSVLAGLDRPTSGTVSLDDRLMTELSEEELSQFRAKHLSIVFQQFHLMSNLTGLENISLPLEIMGNKEALKLAQEELANVGLEHRKDHFPAQLSGGECQRIAIARALVVKPKILLADEPSGNLDAKTGFAVMSLLFKLAESHHTTLILVTHNEKLAERCQRQLVLRDGRLQPLGN